MKIGLALIKAAVKGGKERDCLALGRYLAARGHEVHVLTTQPDHIREPSFAVEGVPVQGWTNHARLAAFGEAVRHIRREGGYEAVITFEKIPGCDFHYAAELPRPLKRLGALNRLPRYRTFLRLEAALHTDAAATRIFYLSERQRAEYAERYGSAHRRGHVLPVVRHAERPPPRVFYADRDAVRRKFDIPQDAILAVFVATKPFKKGFPRILAAMKDLPALQLLVIGTPRTPKFAFAAALRGVGDRIRTVPYAEDVMPLIGAADLLVHPPDDEAAGLTIIESLLAGVPVVVTANCGYAEVVARSGAGVVVPTPFRHDALVAAIRTVLSDLAEMKARARAEAEALEAEPSWLALIADTVERHVNEQAARDNRDG